MNILAQIIYPAIDEFNSTLPPQQQLIKSTDTVLFGHGATIDSIQMVSLIIEAEELLQDLVDEDMKLVTEESLARQDSPFKNIANLASYIEELIAANTVAS